MRAAGVRDAGFRLANAHNVFGEGCGDLACGACTGLEVLTDEGGRDLRAAARDQLAIESLSAFIRRVWHVIEPATPLTWGWHVDLLCDELERVTNGETQRLVICIPPGHMKSLIVSVFWPAWSWLHDPSWSAIVLSNVDDLTERDARKMREVVTSPEYLRLVRRAERASGRAFRIPWGLKSDQNQIRNFANTRHGFRLSISMESAVTGKRARGMIIDDPYDAKEAIKGEPAAVARRMGDVVQVYDQVLPTRVNNPKTAFEVIIMQRLHESDLAGVLIKRGDHRVVCLDAVYEPDSKLNHPNDPRTKAGELLFPAMYPADVLDRFKRRMGSRQFNAQFRQRPTPDEGGLFKRDQFRRYPGETWARAVGADEVAVTVDCAFKDTAASDFVVFQAWARHGSKFYILDELRARMDLPATVRALALFLARWPRTSLVLIEDKANGTGVIQIIAGKIPNVIPYSPTESKYARAQVAAISVEAGDALIPDDAFAAWIEDWIAEFVGFGCGGAHDDRVDATSQLLIRWTTAAFSDAAGRLDAEFGGMFA